MSAKRQDQEEATREKTKEQAERGECKKNVQKRKRRKREKEEKHAADGMLTLGPRSEVRAASSIWKPRSGGASA